MSLPETKLIDYLCNNHSLVTINLFDRLNSKISLQLFEIQAQILLAFLSATLATAKGTFPWVSSFADVDCNPPGAGDGKSLDIKRCKALNFTNDYVLINYGGGSDDTMEFDVFADAN